MRKALAIFQPQTRNFENTSRNNFEIGGEGGPSMLNMFCDEDRNSLAIYLPSPVQTGRAKVHTAHMEALAG